jgi:hypothetical protein
MALKPIKLNFSVGRQRVTNNTNAYEASYIGGIKNQMSGIINNFQQLCTELSLSTPDVLLEALEPTFELSQKYVPVDTGELKASGYLEIDERSRFPRVVMGYGKNGDPSYAALVHEKVELNHKSPTRSKYLLTALEEDEQGIRDRVVKGFKTLLGTR